MNTRAVALAVLVALAAAGGVTATTNVLSLDDDALPAAQELLAGTDPLHPDTDRDGLNDSAELRYGTNPLEEDTDDDGVADYAEVRAYGTDPTAADSDDDGLSDRAELDEHGTDPNKADTDGDGLRDAREATDLGTDPTDEDTDGDGLGDDRELETDTDPLDADTDNDQLRDGEEVLEHRTDPLDPDTDGDGVEDGAEIDRYGSDPRSRHSDGDGLDDGAEVNEHGTDPAKTDTDGDGLDDREELSAGTDPLEEDTDGDGLGDGIEANDEGPLTNADPLRMDVFVEVDYMADERPSNRALWMVVEAYADAPIENPDGSTGITLHVVVSDELPSEDGTVVDGLQQLQENNADFHSFGYHYAVAVRVVQTPDGTAGGQSGMGTFMFQTGWSDLGRSFPDTAQADIFMHELGHSVGLFPGDFDGIDSTEYSYSEYESVMNYDAPRGAVGYNSGEPFDDWQHLAEEMYTPTPYEAEPV